MCFFIFILFWIEIPVSKQCRPWSESDLGLHCLPRSQKWDARHVCFKLTRNWSLCLTLCYVLVIFISEFYVHFLVVICLIFEHIYWTVQMSTCLWLLPQDDELNPVFWHYFVTHLYCKNLDTRKNYCNYPKIWLIWIFHGVVHLNDADGMANSVDPDQSDLGLHCLLRPVCPKI